MNTATRASSSIHQNLKFSALKRKSIPNPTYLVNLPPLFLLQPFGSSSLNSYSLSKNSSSPPVLHRFKLSCSNGSSFDGSNELNFDSISKFPDGTGFDSQSDDGDDNNNHLSRSSALVDRRFRSAAWIGAATAASKILGLLREIVVAAVFGVGPVATAFKHASVLPGFFTSILGGVNGPIHITMTTTLSKLSDKSRRKLIQNTLSIMLLIGGVLGALIFMLAESIIRVSAPGLWILTEGQITREIAISQLKLMIPCIVFAGPVGLSFGCLSAEGDSIFACISPALSSISIIILCVIYVLMRGSNAMSPDDPLFGGVLVSFGASLGVFLQWLIQVVVHEKTRYCFFSVSWVDILKDKDVHKVNVGFIVHNHLYPFNAYRLLPSGEERENCSSCLSCSLFFIVFQIDASSNINFGNGANSIFYRSLLCIFYPRCCCRPLLCTSPRHGSIGCII